MKSANEPADRGQLILLTAAVIAFALATGALAYLQVGYHPDVGHDPDEGSTREVVLALERSLHDATSADSRGTDWDERSAVAAELDERLGPRVETLQESQLESGVAHEITYNETAAESWARAECPNGPDRRFGACEAIGGVVVQERVGETHVLGVAVNIETTSDRQRQRTTERITGKR